MKDATDLFSAMKASSVGIAQDSHFFYRVPEEGIVNYGNTPDAINEPSGMLARHAAWNKFVPYEPPAEPEDFDESDNTGVPHWRAILNVNGCYVLSSQLFANKGEAILFCSGFIRLDKSVPAIYLPELATEDE